MKKILQISNYQYPHIGGIEQVARDIADSLLDDKEIEQKMICFNEDMFYLKTKNLEIRQAYIKFMKENDILCVFHYVPLHSAPAGLKFGRFDGVDENTTADSDRLVRLPMYYNIKSDDLNKVIEKTLEFFNSETK